MRGGEIERLRAGMATKLSGKEMSRRETAGKELSVRRTIEQLKEQARALD
jgi:hypothetical protein